MTPTLEGTEADSEDDPSLPIPVSPTASYDLERIPMHLRDIFVYAQSLGIADHESRRHRIGATTPGELRQVADAVAPYLDDIRSWRNQEPKPGRELALYLSLAKAHAEIEDAIVG